MSSTDEPTKRDISLDEFPMPTYEEWKEAAIAALKGAPFEKVMFTKLVDGLTLNPIYNAEDAPASLPQPGQFPYRRGTNALGYQGSPWQIAQTAHGRCPASFNKAALAELKGGSTAITVDMSRCTGTKLSKLSSWNKAFEGIVLGALPVYLTNGGGAASMAMLIECCKAQGGDPATLKGGMIYDPIAMMLKRGHLCKNIGLDTAMAQMTSMTKWACESGADFTTIGVDGSCYQDCGAAAPDEVAFMLATALQYLREMEKAGLTIDEAASHIAFRVGIGSNLFLEVAKLRALRQLWAEMVRQCGGSDEAAKIRIHAVTSAWTLTSTDPWVNILRGTTQAFAAVLGGVESLDVRPFDESVRPTEEFAAHLGRNIQLMLAGEFCLDKVADPAGGSFYVENLTDSFAREAYARFQAIEAQGGIIPAITEGRVQAAVAAAAEKRLTLADQRRQSIIGVNKYVNVDEKPLEAPEAAEGSSCCHKKSRCCSEEAPALACLCMKEICALVAQETCCACAVQAAMAALVSGGITEVTPLEKHHLAERFEALHAKVHAWQAAHDGARPQVILANQGTLRQHKARADFSQDFLRAGGFDVVYPDGAATPEESAAAVVASGCKACVICSTDDTYPEIVPAFCAALKAAAPGVRILLAGYPVDAVESFKAAGVDDFIHIKANCHKVLADLQNALGL